MFTFKKVTGFLRKNSKKQINTAYSTGTFPFELIFGPEKGPFVDGVHSISVGVRSDRHLLECTPVASYGILAQPFR